MLQTSHTLESARAASQLPVAPLGSSLPPRPHPLSLVLFLLKQKNEGWGGRGQGTFEGRGSLTKSFTSLCHRAVTCLDLGG